MDVTEDSGLETKPTMQVTDFDVELGATGLKHSGGVIDEEILKDLQFPRCINVYRQMECDPLIGAALLAINQFIMSSTWSVVKCDNPKLPKAEAEKQAEFLRQCMFEDMERPFSEVISEMLSFLVYGFSFHELVFKIRAGKNDNPLLDSKYSDGKFGFRDFPIRSQDSITEFVMKHGRLSYIHQDDFYEGVSVDIPAKKLLHFRTSAYKNNPMGKSILRNAYRAYYFRRNLEVQEGVGVERDLTGIPLLRAPAEYLSKDASPAQKAMVQKLQRIGTSLKRNDQSYIMLPSELQGDGNAATGMYQFDISLLSSPGTRQLGLEQSIQRHDYRSMQSLAADFIMMGSQSVGSYALSSNKVAAFVTATKSYLDTMADQFNTKAIPLLWEANGWNPELCPKLAHDGIEEVSLEILGDFLKKAGESGFITPDEEIEQNIRERANLPHKQADEIGALREKTRQQKLADAQASKTTPVAPATSNGGDNVEGSEDG